MSQVQKIRKLQYLFHGNKQGISCIEIMLVLNFDPSSKCYKRKKNTSHLAVVDRWTDYIV